MKTLHTESFKVRHYDIDLNKELSTPALLRLMQETAMQHVLKLKLSVWDLEPQQLAWFLMRKKVTIFKPVLLGENIKIETYPSGIERLFTYRDFLVYNEAGELVAQATTTWLLINTESKRMTRITEDLLNFPMPTEEDSLPRAKDKFPKMESVDFKEIFEVRWHELDFNEHLNNVHFAQWILESLDKEILSKKALESIDILYRAEATYQEQVESQCQALGEGVFLHRLIRISDGKEIASAKTIWK